MQKVVVITGAGISAESGLNTFRDANGYWQKYRFEEIASPLAWQNNPEIVLEFYNERRQQLPMVQPNEAHYSLKRLEEKYRVTIITQNVDDLHERAGSSNILHLHGELVKARSSIDSEYVEIIGYRDIALGDKCPKGHQLRPHIVWFGETVDMISLAIEITALADMIIIIGTSLQVYPAASLIQYAKRDTPIFYIDPQPNSISNIRYKLISERASVGVPALVSQLLKSGK